MPENVRLIVSTLPGRPLDEIKKRGWPTLKVELLTAMSGRIVDRTSLNMPSASVCPGERIAAAPQSANPLYLRVLLDELRRFGEYERLEERISYYLKAESIVTLYQRVIARWEEDTKANCDLVR